ncbi:MAG: DUF5687 family protein [Bacteroidota bacterium]
MEGMSSLQIMITLLRHGWLSFRRAHYFERNMGIKILMVFVGLIVLWNLFMLGVVLPDLMTHLFPEKAPHTAFFSLLLYIYAGDLVVRLFTQKVARQLVRSYLTLPVSRHLLAGFILLRSWVNIFNFYLFPLLIPFFLRSLTMSVSPGAAWLAIIGCFLLGGLNHALVIWFKTWPSRTTGLAVILLLTIGMALFGGLLFPERFMALSERLGHSFISGEPYVFIFLIILIAGLQLLSKKGLIHSFYDWAGSATRSFSTGDSLMERLFAKVPRFAPWWELEWKLITRNKRAANGLLQTPFLVAGIPLVMYFMQGENPLSFIYLFVMASGGYGYFHLQYAYSWESRFFDMIASRGISLYRFILAKYYFYVLLGLAQTALIIPLLAITNAALILPWLGIFLHVTGPIFAFLLYTGIGNSTRIDPNKSASFNFEGTSGMLFLTILASILSVVVLSVIAYFLPWPAETAIGAVTGLSGISFILFHKRWINAITHKFLRNKYHNLYKYRET